MDGKHQIGRVVDGRYVVEALLGEGGMGVVLRAQHKFTGAPVALKMLRPELVGDAHLQARFLAESRLPTAIGHPGIAQVLDAGITPEGELYLAMELLTGRSLRQAMYPSIPRDVAIRIGLELLDALSAAHARGIVHRDLKPENVFLTAPHGTVKLLDFGIAKASAVAAQHTAAGMMLGTLAYMAPEQIHDASTVDARADLWAVGVILYEMFAGRLPYPATDLASIYHAITSSDPDPITKHLPAAPPAMQHLFMKALARDRGRRYVSATVMAADLADLRIGSIPGASAASPVVQPMPSYSQGVAPTLATPPPPVSTPPYAAPPMPPPPVPTPPPPVPTPPPAPAITSMRSSRKQSALPLVVVGGLIVVGAAIGIGVVAGRKGEPPPKRNPGSAVAVAPRDAGTAVAIDGAAVVTVAPDAAVVVAVAPPPDAATVTGKTGMESVDTSVFSRLVPTAPPPPTESPATRTPRPGATANARQPGASEPAADAHECLKGCEMVKKCGLAASVGECTRTCDADAGVRRCVLAYPDSCAQFSSCILGNQCGFQPEGSQSCATAAQCAVQCGDETCTCGCMREMNPRSSKYMLSMLLCLVGCSGDTQCIEARCTKQVEACLAH